MTLTGGHSRDEWHAAHETAPSALCKANPGSHTCSSCNNHNPPACLPVPRHAHPLCRTTSSAARGCHLRSRRPVPAMPDSFSANNARQAHALLPALCAGGSRWKSVQVGRKVVFRLARKFSSEQGKASGSALVSSV